jgi:hypothetical protein
MLRCDSDNWNASVSVKYMLKRPMPKDPPVWTKRHVTQHNYLDGFSHRPRLRGGDLIFTIFKPVNAQLRIKQWRPTIAVSPPCEDGQKVWGITYGGCGFDPASDMRGRKPRKIWAR